MRRLLGSLVFILVAATTLPAVADDIESARDRIFAIETLIEDAQARANLASELFWAAESDLEQLEVDMADLQSQIDQSELELEELSGAVRSFAVERYTGETLTPDLIEQDDINEYSVMSYLARDLQLDTVDVVDAYRLVQANLDSATEEMETQVAEQERLIGEIESARATIDAELVTMNEELANQQAILDALEEEERRRIEAERAARRREAAAAEAARAAAEAAARATSTTATPSTAAPAPTVPGATTIPGAPTTTVASAPATTVPSGPIATGSWVCPVQGAVSFSDTYGQARSGGRRHQGVDMMAASGTPVVAPVSGTVTQRDNSLGGLSFHLEGSDGNYYYGTHLASYGNSGSVQAGTVIGYVGSTGNATTPHLHFEIHQGGRGNPINPTPTVAQFC